MMFSNRKSIVRILVMVMTVVVLQACSTSRKGQSSTGMQTGEMAVTESQVAELYKQTVSNYSDWEKVKVPISVSLSQPAQISVSGTAVMERGKSVSISMRILGMEVASMYLSNDSIVILDRWNKRYVCEELRRFLGDFPISVSNVQDMLTGRPFVLGTEQLNASDAGVMEFEVDGQYWACKPKEMPAWMEYAFAFLGQSMVSVTAGIAGKTPVVMNYSNEQITPFGPMAANVEVYAVAGSKKVDGTISWKFGKASWNGDVTLKPVNIPVGYNRVYAADILKSFAGK